MAIRYSALGGRQTYMNDYEQADRQAMAQNAALQAAADQLAAQMGQQAMLQDDRQQAAFEELDRRNQFTLDRDMLQPRYDEYYGQGGQGVASERNRIAMELLPQEAGLKSAGIANDMDKIAAEQRLRPGIIDEALWKQGRSEGQRAIIDSGLMEAPQIPLTGIPSIDAGINAQNSAALRALAEGGFGPEAFESVGTTPEERGAVIAQQTGIGDARGPARGGGPDEPADPNEALRRGLIVNQIESLDKLLSSPSLEPSLRSQYEAQRAALVALLFDGDAPSAPGGIRPSASRQAAIDAAAATAAEEREAAIDDMDIDYDAQDVDLAEEYLSTDDARRRAIIVYTLAQRLADSSGGAITFEEARTRVIKDLAADEERFLTRTYGTPNVRAGSRAVSDPESRNIFRYNQMFGR